MSCGAPDVRGDATAGISPPSKRRSKPWRRRQCVEDLLTSCAAEVLQFERAAAREAAASERVTRILKARGTASCSSLGTTQSSAPLPPTAPSSSSCSPPLGQGGAEGGGAGLTIPTDEVGRTAGGEERSSAWPTGGGNACLEYSSEEGNVHSDSSTVGAGSRREESGNDALALQLLRMLSHDNTVMESDLREYDEALGCTLREVVRLKSEANQMKRVCGQVGQLQDLLHKEMHVHAQLKQENAELQEKHHELCAVIQEATEATDLESEAVIDGLIYENTTLRRLLFRTDTSSVNTSDQGSSVVQGALQWTGSLKNFKSDAVAGGEGYMDKFHVDSQSPDHTQKRPTADARVSSAEDDALSEASIADTAICTGGPADGGASLAAGESDVYEEEIHSPGRF